MESELGGEKMKIYTKTGDKGSTSLVGGERATKYDLRVWAYGSIDEVNSAIGVARAYILKKDLEDKLLRIQKTLFEVGAELASLGTKYYKERIESSEVEFLEDTIDELDKLKPSSNGFIVPGGTKESAQLDAARTAVRRAERYICAIKNSYYISQNLLSYVNRLSDALYAMARYFDYEDILKRAKERVRNIKQGENLKNMRITRKIAEDITKKCIESGEEIGVPMVICVCDYDGIMVMLQRMDDSLLASIEIAMKKAYTAAAMKSPTHEISDTSKPGGELYGINNMDKIITFGGGFPLKVENKIIGAIGVSGGTVKQDMSVAAVGVKYFEEVILNGIRS